ncbi:hypothetical protein Tmar_0706 [Thermaerobacter marianensis DSM 12885]|uniref:Uncharacterized protein n=1 Tax=Thermaerobacter marianensis (strain ATCC 700841 / DSM 12885 / JCM 10246 / 7p75a) TaxID=644966 RepID=E6SI43_THEM7|nr:hypothetical protein Tmar_0706 [Thermaerobacter marianensis DSM 12885]
MRGGRMRGFNAGPVVVSGGSRESVGARGVLCHGPLSSPDPILPPGTFHGPAGAFRKEPAAGARILSPHCFLTNKS